MASKKYISLSKLSTFLDNLKNTFALLIHTHTVSDIADIDSLELITVDNVDAVCGSNIQMANEMTF